MRAGASWREARFVPGGSDQYVHHRAVENALQEGVETTNVNELARLVELLCREQELAAARITRGVSRPMIGIERHPQGDEPEQAIISVAELLVAARVVERVVLLWVVGVVVVGVVARLVVFGFLLVVLF